MFNSTRNKQHKNAARINLHFVLLCLPRLQWYVLDISCFKHGTSHPFDPFDATSMSVHKGSNKGIRPKALEAKDVMKVFNGLNFSHIDSLSSSSDSEAEASETSGLNGQSTSESEEASLLSMERMWTFSGGKSMGFFSLFSLPTRLPATFAPSELFLLLLFVRVLGLAPPTSSAVISISLNLKTSWGNGRKLRNVQNPPWNQIKSPHDSRAAKFWGKNPDGSPFLVEKTPKTSPCNDSYKGIFLTYNFPGFLHKIQASVRLALDTTRFISMLFRRERLPAGARIDCIGSATGGHGEGFGFGFGPALHLSATKGSCGVHFGDPSARGSGGTRTWGRWWSGSWWRWPRGGATLGYRYRITLVTAARRWQLKLCTFDSLEIVCVEKGGWTRSINKHLLPNGGGKWWLAMVGSEKKIIKKIQDSRSRFLLDRFLHWSQR